MTDNNSPIKFAALSPFRGKEFRAIIGKAEKMSCADHKRMVRITSGCPNKCSWGQTAIVVDEYLLNGEKHLLVDMGGNWLLVKEVFTEDYDGLLEARAAEVSV
jgi:hypothetical protein